MIGRPERKIAGSAGRATLGPGSSDCQVRLARGGDRRFRPPAKDRRGSPRFALRGVQVLDVAKAPQRADVLLVLLSAISTEVTIFAEATRWRTLFHLRTGAMEIWSAPT